jgi:hypothetical protein
MDALSLHSHVSYGLVDGRAIFLDLKRDRYLTLARADDLAFRRMCAPGAHGAAGRGGAERLLATGLFGPRSPAGRPAPVTVPLPAASLLDEPATPRAGLIAATRAWRKVARARKRLHAAPLHAIVEDLRARHSGAAGGAGAEDAARLFLAARRLVPIERSCLLDALALLDWLGGRAAGTRLVFGVRTNPFRAHCWVQTDRLLLTDAHDEVAQLVPVLAV